MRALKPASADELRALHSPMVSFSLQMKEKNRVLQAFLSHRMYRHERVLAMVDSRIYRGEAPVRTSAFPAAANPLRWTGLAEVSDSYVMLQVGLPDDFDPTRGRDFFKAVQSPAMQAAARTHPFRVFLDFSAFPLWRTMPAVEPETATRVDVLDLRFGNPDQPGFNATAVVDASNHVLSAGFGFGRIQPK